MTRVTPADIERIASLARLAIDPRTMPALAAQIEQIVRYVSQLEAVDPQVGAISPAWMEAGTIPPLRSDDVSPPALAGDLDRMAPVFRDGFFLVPRLASWDEE